MYGFQTEFQKNMLKSKSAGTVCIDGTHGTTSHKTHLFTLLIRDDEGGQGAHLISEKKAGETLICWLNALKNQNQEWIPHTFITDCDDAQQNAIHAVYPNVKILLCQWHVKHAWQKNKGKIKADCNNFKAQEASINNGNLGRTKKTSHTKSRFG